MKWNCHGCMLRELVARQAATSATGARTSTRPRTATPTRNPGATGFLKWSGLALNGAGYASDGVQVSTIPVLYYPPAPGILTGFSIALPFLGTNQSFAAELRIDRAAVARIAVAGSSGIGPAFAAPFVAPFVVGQSINVVITCNQTDLRFTATASLA